MPETTFYELLGVEPSASQAEIKSAFRQQALRNHPDQGGNPALFHLVEEAYETLVSPSRRSQYDIQHGIHAAARSGPGSHYSYDRASDQDDEPTRQWNASDWNTNDWQGDDASAWNSREPQAPPRPTYVIDDDDQQFVTGRFSFLNRIPEFPWTSVKLAGLALTAWLVMALIFHWQAIPGVKNSTVFVSLICIVLVWIWGSFLMRVGAIILGVWTIWQAHNYDMTAGLAFVLLGFGFLLWLTGHWLYTFKHGEPKSVIAAMFHEILPGPLHPQWRWGRHVIDRMG